MKKPVDPLTSDSNSVIVTPFQRLVMHSAVVAALLGGVYGRAAYAGSCTSGPVSVCSGPADNGVDTTQNLTRTPLTVSTRAGFGIDTSANGGDGFYLVGYDGLTFTDNNSSLITGRNSGIYAFNKGIGALSITSSGVVTGVNENGISAISNGNYNLDMTIQTAVVTGRSGGIFARNSGVGALSITSSGIVTGTNGDGIWAENGGSRASGLTLQTVAVTGGSKGIFARNSIGALSITSVGTVTGAGGDGLYASNAGTDISLQTSVVTGSENGISARNYGSGALRITSSGAVTGVGGNGIQAFNISPGTDLTVQTAIVTGGKSGIHAFNSGRGALNITNSDSVTSTGGDGITAVNFGTDLVVQTVVVHGSESGIDAFNRGNGALNITSSGEVSGSGRDGISAVNYGTDLNLRTVAVTGGYRGSYLRNNGHGALDFTSSGAVTGTENDGIYAVNLSYSTSLTLQTDMVTGLQRGLNARNGGSGALTITSTGIVTGNNDRGIFAQNFGTDLTVQAAAVTGGYIGIDNFNVGVGALSITSSGAVTGGYFGIVARNFGNGALSIMSSEAVTGISRIGIVAYNHSLSSSLTLQTAAVTGEYGGINANNDGIGALTITTSDVVTGTQGTGIYAVNFGTDLTLQTTAVSGGYRGVDARNYGGGALNITSAEEVTGKGGEGISAVNFGTDLTLQTAAVTGGNNAIRAVNRGSGALSITSSGAVKSVSIYDGIDAFNFGTDLALQTAEVIGEYFGIHARQNGSGAMSITSSGEVSGMRQSGIYARNYLGTDLIVQTAAVSGGNNGIYVRNDGSDALVVMSGDRVQGGRYSEGIVARNSGTGLTLRTAGVIGGSGGIFAVQNGSGALNITTDGLVRAGTGYALSLEREVDGTTTGTITNNGGLLAVHGAAVLMTSGLNFEGDFNNNADISGGNGTAFDASATANGIVLNQAAGTITGNILLGSGDDSVTITGGAINGQIIGQGFGLVTVDVGAGNDFSGNGVVNVADYVIQSGIVHQMADFSTAATTTTVASGATLSFGSVIHGGGALVSNGDLAFVLSPGLAGELTQAGVVTLNSGSTITLDTKGLSPVLNESFHLISATDIIDNGVVVTKGAFGSLLYEFEALVDSSSLSVVTAVADLGAISPLKNPSAFGDSMTAFVSGGGDNAVVELLAGLDSGDVAGFEQVADVFSPSVSGAVSQGSREANDSTWRLINERFVGSETALHISEPPNGLWLQGYGGTTDQDAIDDVEGFDADTSGVAVGYDLNLVQWRVGAAFSAGETDIDNDRFASDSINIESNQFIVYGSYLQNQWFANASVSAASLDYDLKRNNMIAGEGPIEGDTDGDLLGMSVGGGYKYTVLENILLTPQLNLRYTTLDVDDYTEDGGLDLRVEYDSIDTFAAELGVSASAIYAADDWQLAPTVRLGWVHEYLNENEKVTARYSDQFYIQEGFDPDQDFASVGLGFEASNENGVNISLDYRGTFGSDYSSNQGWVNLRYEF